MYLSACVCEREREREAKIKDTNGRDVMSFDDCMYVCGLIENELICLI